MAIGEVEKTSTKCSDHHANVRARYGSIKLFYHRSSVVDSLPLRQLKANYVQAKRLRNMSGFGWDDGRKLVIATNEQEYRTFEGEATTHRTCRDFLVTDRCADTTFPVSVEADPSHFVKRHVYFVINPPNSSILSQIAPKLMRGKNVQVLGAQVAAQRKWFAEREPTEVAAEASSVLAPQRMNE